MRFKSIKHKILFWFSSVIFIILFIFSYALYYLLEESINKRILEQLEQYAISLHLDLKENKFNTNIIIDETLKDVEVAILKKNKLIYQTKKFTLKNYETLYQEPQLYINEINNFEVDAIYSYKFTNPFVGNILLYKKNIHNQAEDIEHILLGTIPILLIVLMFLANKIIDKILIPIKNITRDAKNITVSDLSTSIENPSNKDEISELISSFNSMISRLKEGVSKLDTFNKNVSHEFRTPLTIIKGEAEVTLKNIREPDYYIKSLEVILKAVNQLSNITDEMLFYTKYTKYNVKNSFSWCQLDSIIMNIIEQYNNDLKNKNINLTLKEFHSLKYLGNHNLLHTIFKNLVDNAIKYSHNNSNINIELYLEENYAIFKIQDEGIGIPKDKIEKVTDEFFRVEESRNKNIQGVGLGLFIVKSCIDLHKGILQINSTNQGTLVTVKLPL
ncbi:two-component system sensor histidine kinase [Malaciobacter marinus]|uniref:histidine kinase n=1 Tax=Malaciobacter marinus TaxID=505249 RepID=A0A1T5C366_9BACT|nr:HAMP domain-containing sensor histidine kinase [Malaciobacter marinus]AXX87546.1 two-component system sensor histidine kinase [Malaciobacter marinus]PHO14487.1 sensor histidine kinase [Malaciobacter marinus]PPK60695.1 signal transduction histidine kinase [Malaciobacter marinus]SKB53550.1 Signal transduction histidine kinase [Malaciobacter marinus]